VTVVREERLVVGEVSGEDCDELRNVAPTVG
jgi:hypothetical protein